MRGQQDRRPSTGGGDGPVAPVANSTPLVDREATPAVVLGRVCVSASASHRD
jgi:hypothetical protein